MSESNHTTTTTVEAAFADAAQAERAVVQLQEHGVPPEQLDTARRIVRDRGGTLQ